jgi:ribosomal protein L34E
VSSRTARAIQRNPVSKTNKKQKKKKKKKKDCSRSASALDSIIRQIHKESFPGI